MDAAVAALVGAALGAAGSVAGVWLTQRAQSNRELLKTAADLALADYNEMLARIARQGGGKVPPVSAFVAYHADVLIAIAKGQFDADAVARIEAKQQALSAAMPDRTKPPES